MNILDEIVAHKRLEVRRRQKELLLSRLFESVRERSATKGFKRALEGGEKINVIAEIKKASPSAGIIREDFDHKAIATIYAGNGAAAISVLTDEKYFQGKLGYLADVRGTVGIPLLRKDFIVDPYQVVEARAAGADAILLIMHVLSRDQCMELAAAAREYQLDYLVEVHSVRELELALTDDFSLIGINNRDLTDFSVDLATTEKLSQIAPEGTTLISESGIKDRADIERLAQARIQAVLVGETFMRQDDIAKAVQEFCGVPRC